MITSALIHLGTYVRSKKALEACKSELEEYLDSEKLDQLDGSTTGTGARFIQRNNRTLDLIQMPDELVVWCARAGLFNVSISKFDEQPDETRSNLDQYVTFAAGTRYVDLFRPAWGQAAQTKKETARAANTAPPPPTPLRPEPVAEPQATPVNVDNAKCPVHGRAKQSKHHSGVYCPEKLGEGVYCDWSTKKAS
jgi:hypothetical protein